jgi:hypothetical protein
VTAPSDQSGRRDNGLTAETYVPLVDVDPAVADVLLTALRRARIAAYLDMGPAGRTVLYVAESERGDARTIVVAAARHARATNSAAPEGVGSSDEAGPLDPFTIAGDPDPIDLASAASTAAPNVSPSVESTPTVDSALPPDTDATFREMVANWHVDTVAAVRAAEKDLSAEDAEWRARLQPVEAADEEEHYVPPPPPPLPRLALQTVWALIVLILSVAMLAFGGLLNLGGDVSFFLGVGGILVGTGMLLMRLRDSPTDDGDDDGAVV